VRSLALNGAVSGAGLNIANPTYPMGRTYFNAQKMAQLRRPSETFVAVDEHPDSINDSVFMYDPGAPPPIYGWRDLPASYHNGAAGFSFADGHSEIHKWEDERTVQPILQQSKPWGDRLSVPNSVDIEWMNNRMPWR
jgi:prepilin-type processing-associated H-X9-DG protein